MPPSFTSEKHNFEGHRAPINCLDFSVDGRYLVSGGDNGYAWITDMDSLYRQRLSTKQTSVIVAKWLPYVQANGVIWLVTGGSDGTLKVWRNGGRETDFKLWKATTCFNTPIEDMSITGRHVAVGRRLLKNAGDAINLMISSVFSSKFEDLEGTVEGSLQEGGLPRYVEFISKGRKLLTGVLDTKILICWNLKTGRQRWREKLEHRIGNASWDEDTRILLVWTLQDGIMVYRIEERPVVLADLMMEIERNFPMQMCFVGEGIVATGSDNGEVLVWDLAQAEVRKRRVNGESFYLLAGGSSETKEPGIVKLVSRLTNMYEQTYNKESLVDSQQDVLSVPPQIVA
ncbi:WD40-repeat-containing domain protein [Coprinopsis sp. MPI-PUGE-AT-0042]|nr:WD40-repeat-containing domain protein [Coprinopsis sp. MPI-PUGE-AT-0042]